MRMTVMDNLWNSSLNSLSTRDVNKIQESLLSVFRYTCRVSAKFMKKKEISPAMLKKAARLQKNIQRFLLLFHHSLLSQQPSWTNPSYQDICSGLCSIVLDLHIVRVSNGKNSNLSGVLSTLFIILDSYPTYILDAVLGSSTLLQKNISQWNDICKRLLSSQPVESHKSSLIYFKYILTLLKWKFALPKSEKNVVRTIVYSSKAPATFISWMKDNYADILPEISSCDSNSKLQKLLLKKVIKRTILNSLIESLIDGSGNDHDGGAVNADVHDKISAENDLFFIDKASYNNPDENNAEEISDSDSHSSDAVHEKEIDDFFIVDTCAMENPPVNGRTSDSDDNKSETDLKVNVESITTNLSIADDDCSTDDDLQIVENVTEKLPPKGKSSKMSEVNKSKDVNQSLKSGTVNDICVDGDESAKFVPKSSAKKVKKADASVNLETSPVDDLQVAEIVPTKSTPKRSSRVLEVNNTDDVSPRKSVVKSRNTSVIQVSAESEETATPEPKSKSLTSAKKMKKVDGSMNVETSSMEESIVDDRLATDHLQTAEKVNRKSSTKKKSVKSIKVEVVKLSPRLATTRRVNLKSRTVNDVQVGGTIEESIKSRSKRTRINSAEKLKKGDASVTLESNSNDDLEVIEKAKGKLPAKRKSSKMLEVHGADEDLSISLRSASPRKTKPKFGATSNVQIGVAGEENSKKEKKMENVNLKAKKSISPAYGLRSRIVSRSN